MSADRSESELLRLAQALDDGRVDWNDEAANDPTLIAGIEGLRDIEAIATAMSRELPPDPGAEARAWLEPGSMLGRYPIEREAGRGGMGVVYLARDLVLDRPVALKLLPPDLARAPERLARFTHEAKLLASLNHPNVATIYGLEEESSGLRFLALEWVAGESLAARLQRGPLPWREALEVCGQIARGVTAAHEGGVIHRDLKPGNVMLTPQGRIKVLDFGLARRGAAPADMPAGPSEPAVRGTWGYVSPECLTRDEDHRADVFAFGCVLYECLAGLPAFPGESVDEIRDALLHREPDETRLPPDTPPTMRRLIASCVTKDPDRRLGSMAEALRTIEAALGSRRAPTTRSETASAVPHRLPEETDSFVGRDDELGELAGRLRRGARLVTLQGPGGMGKTRLAVRYGWRSLEEWPGGVWFCDLTEARNRDGIAAAVAGALGVPLGKADPVEQLGHVIAGRGQCLLILDNFEQVVAEAGATVSPWLARAADARFVVTSREQLDLPEEEVQTIEPLGSEPGVELFVERARRQRPGFEPDGRDAEAVREVVRWVEGMPLALELAAARVRVMSPVQIVERMRERFRLLSGIGGGRHGTLRATIDGSWELLAPWEQAAFAQCAVFEGGFTLAAAEAVLDLKEWSEAPWIPDVVQSLVDRSLLRTRLPERESGADPEVRFGMFVSLQEYARAKLAEEGAIPEGGSGATAVRAAEERHGRCYARHGSEGEIAALHQRGGPERMRVLGRELDNLVAACRRAAARGDGEVALASCEAAWEVFHLRGPFGSAVDLSREVLAALHEESDRRRALTTLGHAEWRSGQVREAVVHLETALALHRRVGHRRMEGKVLRILSALHCEQGQMAEGRAQLEAALTIARESGDRRFEGIVVCGLGALHHQQGRMDEARTHYETSLLISREVGDRNFEGQILGNLGLLCAEQGRMEEARTHYEAALLIAREVGNRYHEGLILGYLGTRQLEQGQWVEARARFEAALAIDREVGNRRFEGILLGELGRLHLEQGRLEEARKLVAEGDGALRDVGDRIALGKLLCVRAELERRSGDLLAARATLGEAGALATEVKAGPDSELGLQLAKLRQALAAKS